MSGEVNARVHIPAGGVRVSDGIDRDARDIRDQELRAHDGSRDTFLGRRGRPDLLPIHLYAVGLVEALHVDGGYRT